MKVALRHITRHSYGGPVNLGPHLVRLYPGDPVISYELRVSPGHVLHWQEDPLGNRLARLVFQEPAEELSVEVHLVVDLQPVNPFDFLLDNQALTFPFEYPQDLRQQLAPYLDPPSRADRLRCWLGAGGEQETVPFVLGVAQKIQEEVRYQVREEAGVMEPEQTLEAGVGSCRDTAWLMVSIMRALGVAARFVSGYLIEQDRAELHAWAEVYLPGAGWVGVDTTSALLTTEGHLKLAATARPEAAAPISGTFGGVHGPVQDRFESRLEVRRLGAESGRDEPYPADWGAILKAGERVDAELAGLHLTMGGEPTFYNTANPEGPEWGVTALSEEKRRLASAFLHRLRAVFAPRGMLLYGQGKHYPGELLPRWALHCFWKVDTPLWSEDEWLACDGRPGNTPPEAARDFLVGLAAELGLESDFIGAAHEDVYHKLYQERRLSLEVASELGPAVGYYLPLCHRNGWESGDWELEKPVQLVAGDSPIGYRLPLNSLPPDSEVRTALCVQVRNGHLYVFVPPLDSGAAYLDLLAHLQSAARKLQTPLLLEGYPPPPEARVTGFSITPDPGVLEINLHPCADWKSLVEVQTVLHREAAALGLGALKYDYDGRALSTGGGHHLVLGGRSPEESPFRVHRELLPSLLRFWNNHPSLSYLFTGMFVGPTSQAPRLDEARYDSLDELELGFELLQQGDQNLDTVNRVLGHLLTDVSGNRHRAEFCIDKLGHTGQPGGGQGLLELRALEMMPHPQLGLVVQLLVRALVARFWRSPYRSPLVRWGSRLHDEFMLGYFVERDFEAVVAELEPFGIRRAWFDHHFELRFPLLGRVCYDGVEIEVRHALEPWHVISESGADTTRLVDGSMQRIQVRTEGLRAEQHGVAVNGRLLPLKATGPREHVAGVRFKARHQDVCFHPTVPVHLPLVIELVDLGAGQSLGGCTVNAPPDRRPLNQAEARSHREACFVPSGRSLRQGYHPAPQGPGCTLDLRRQP